MYFVKYLYFVKNAFCGNVELGEVTPWIKELECCFFISLLSNMAWYSGSGDKFVLVKVCHLEGQLKIAIKEVAMETFGIDNLI